VVGPDDTIPGILATLFPTLKTVRTTAAPHPLMLRRDQAMADALLHFLNEGT
jgi:hypothetical protein